MTPTAPTQHSHRTAITSDQALVSIASAGCRKGIWGSRRIVCRLALEDDGWHIDYDLKALTGTEGQHLS